MSEKFGGFEDRVRFNWGFHDGSGEASRGHVRSVDGHFDPVYAAGYVAGVKVFQDTGARPELSDAAWRAYKLGARVPFLVYSTESEAKTFVRCAPGNISADWARLEAGRYAVYVQSN